ncbi:MAG TPA: hypothetical protein VJ861_10785, partial [Treponemataceae bacterium]|nr:hypothetical protein [Treponemataceae bacterium]
RYNSHDGNQRWDADVLYVGDASLENALDFQIKPVPGIGYAFFTLMSDEAVTSGVKYANKEFRTIPMMQLGYVYDADLGAMGEVEATLGGALDMYAKKDTDYLGYIAFGGATWSKGNMAVEKGSLVLGLNGLYGQNTATLAGMNGSDMEQATLGMTNLIAMLTAGEKGIARSVSKSGDKNSSVYGGRLFGGATLWTGGIVSLDARVSQLTFAGDSDPFTAIRFTGGLTQFLSGNFSATLGGGYEQYSVQAGNKDYKAASGYEITLDLGYRF